MAEAKPKLSSKAKAIYQILCAVSNHAGSFEIDARKLDTDDGCRELKERGLVFEVRPLRQGRVKVVPALWRVRKAEIAKKI
jgi:hypothetical protein